MFDRQELIRCTTQYIVSFCQLRLSLALGAVFKAPPLLTARSVWFVQCLLPRQDGATVDHTFNTHGASRWSVRRHPFGFALLSLSHVLRGIICMIILLGGLSTHAMNVTSQPFACTMLRYVSTWTIWWPISTSFRIFA